MAIYKCLCAREPKVGVGVECTFMNVGVEV